jgi:hypothetical protein
MKEANLMTACPAVLAEVEELGDVEGLFSRPSVSASCPSDNVIVAIC